MDTLSYTAEAIWQAKEKCPELVLVGTDFPAYLRYAEKMRRIYADFSDRVEPFGLDEAWLDVSDVGAEGKVIADEIRARAIKELGLTVSVRMIWAVLLDLPAALLFIGLGLLCGSVMNVKQVGGICGALLTNLTAWLSGTWFDLELVGGAFQRIAYALPFVHAVELDRAALSGDWASVMPHLWWVLAYAAAALAAAVLLFLRQMKRQ